MKEGEVEIRIGSAEAEKQIAQGSPVSSTPWQEVVGYADLPERLRNLRILDVGSGTSNTTAYLLLQRADAYAVDPRYNDPAILRKLATISIRQQQIHGHRTEARQEQTAMKEFFASFKESHARYKSALASSLPFEDGFFDIVFSIRSISGYVDMDPSTFLKSIDECLRVTKSDGKVILFPFETDTEHIDPHRKIGETLREQSHRQLGAHLMGKVQSAKVHNLEFIVNNKLMRRQRLAIIK